MCDFETRDIKIIFAYLIFFISILSYQSIQSEVSKFMIFSDQALLNGTIFMLLSMPRME